MQWIASAYAHDVIMADEPMHGIRLIEGNMGDYMHAHHHQLHGQGYDAGIHHHKGSDGHHHDHQTKQGNNHESDDFESILSILPAVIVALTALIVMITIAVKRSSFLGSNTQRRWV